MSDAKTFYRELDSVLAKIRIDKTDKNFLVSIVNGLQDSFGHQLSIKNPRIYELQDQHFILTYPNNDDCIWHKEIPLKSDIIEAVQSSRSYIYDNFEMGREFRPIDAKEYSVPAAIWVHNPENQWLIVFELYDGWGREEISLFLNSVRTAINYRLFSDAMGGMFDQAAQIQKSLLPAKSPQIEGYEIYGKSQPAEFVGGDFYDYFDMNDGTFGVALGDASGHGFPAALLVRDVVIGLRMGYAKDMRLVHTVKKLNQVIQKSTYATNFVSMFIGEFEKDGHLFYANAGHPAPFLVKGDFIYELEATGITLGFLPDINIQRAYTRMPEDSTLVIYTDGLTEHENPKGEMFGMQRFQELIVDNQKLSAQEIVDKIFQTIYDWGGQVRWEDDVTIVVVKRKEI